VLFERDRINNKRYSFFRAIQELLVADPEFTTLGTDAYFNLVSCSTEGANHVKRMVIGVVSVLRDIRHVTWSATRVARSCWVLDGITLGRLDTIERNCSVFGEKAQKVRVKLGLDTPFSTTTLHDPSEFCFQLNRHCYHNLVHAHEPPLASDAPASWMPTLSTHTRADIFDVVVPRDKADVATSVLSSSTSMWTSGPEYDTMANKYGSKGACLVALLQAIGIMNPRKTNTAAIFATTAGSIDLIQWILADNNVETANYSGYVIRRSRVAGAATPSKRKGTPETARVLMFSKDTGAGMDLRSCTHGIMFDTVPGDISLAQATEHQATMRMWRHGGLSINIVYLIGEGTQEYALCARNTRNMPGITTLV
jgi:hypothetical protein